MSKPLLALIIFSLTVTANAQVKRDSVSNDRLKKIIIGGSVGYGSALFALNHLWYRGAEKQSFRFFNDNAEWNQVDKIGHFFSAYYLANGAQRSFVWSNVDEQKADLWGAVTGMLLLAPIEVFDGYSARYGASSGDLIANGAGALFFLGQKRLWGEIRIHPKFSYQRSDYASLRSDVLGDSEISRIIKDYNGQTYWLSLDLDKFIRFPSWLNVAVGYGADGMVYAREYHNQSNGFRSFRQIYLSPDIDLTAIKSRSRTIRSLLFFLNMVKIPAPGLEIADGKIHWRALTY